MSWHMSIDREDNEFEILLNKKRHKELIDLLKDILKELPKEFNSSKIEALLETIAQKNDSSIPKSIELIGEAIINKMCEIKDTMDKPKEWTFDVNRNLQGYIVSVTAKQK
jgi:superoxide dismutase